MKEILHKTFNYVVKSSQNISVVGTELDCVTLSCPAKFLIYVTAVSKIDTNVNLSHNFLFLLATKVFWKSWYICQIWKVLPEATILKN